MLSRPVPSGAVWKGKATVALSALVLAGCGEEALWQQIPDKEAGPRPAFPLRNASNFDLQRVSTGLEAPVQVIARPGDRRLYAVERAGTIRAFRPGAAKPSERLTRRPARGTPALEPLLDIRRRVLPGGERGLLSAVFADGGRTLHVMYTRKPDGATRVETIGLSADDAPHARPARELLTVEQPADNHNGGTLLLDRRGRLLLGLGDGGGAFDPDDRAQAVDQRLGKILRHDRNGWRTVARGVRNPWRMSLDRNRLWVGDVGQDRLEEVDAFVPPDPGNPVPNLGWAAFEGNLPLGRKPLVGDSADLVWPVAAYTHEAGLCSITGGYVYRGRRIPRLRGRYVFADFCTGHIFSLDAAGALRGERFADARVENVRLQQLVSFGRDGFGELYAVSMRGTVHKLIPDARGQD